MLQFKLVFQDFLRSLIIADIFQYFSGDYYLCRNAEIDALASACGLRSVSWRAPAGGNHLSPLWYARLPSEEVAHTIAARSMLLKV